MAKNKIKSSDGLLIDISNNVSELLKENVFISKSFIDVLIDNNIPFFEFVLDDVKYYIVRQGTSKKRFNADEVECIKKDLETMSIRKLSVKYNCSVNVIQNIKLGRY
ncbi:helix-turn-helix domain containing protein [Clostridioides difficile]|nr:helix-turn-helix domain containing protein [Clostridioides difficile]